MGKKTINLIQIAFLGALILIVSGCVSSSGKFGGLRHDDSVKHTFENFEVPEGYQFYYYGPSTFPNAFIGISKDYRLESALWQEVELTPELLQKWIRAQANRLPGDMSRSGSRIIGPADEEIGVYYSLGNWKQWIRIELEGEGVVRISGPVYDRDMRRKSYLIFEY